LSAAVEESIASRWARRALTVPGYSLVLVALLVALPVALPTAALYDLARGSRFAATRTVAFFVVYLACEVAGVLAATLLWVFHALVVGLEPTSYARSNFRLQCAWARLLGSAAFSLFGMSVRIEGTVPLGKRPILLLVRHASVADTILAAIFIAGRHEIVLRYVLKRELLWDPCLDIVGNRLVNCFIRRGREDSMREAERVASLAADLGPGEGVLIYPEGTRFSAAKRERILAALASRNDDVAYRRAASLRHVLPPRVGGTLSLLERLKDGDVVVCAHVGLEGAASFSELWSGGLIGSRCVIRVWSTDIEALPSSAEGRIEWLHSQWQSVDRFIESQSDDARLRAPDRWLVWPSSRGA
jgi:1-acyl-sn-glycerol-3-phosphate acyltransferase